MTTSKTMPHFYDVAQATDDDSRVHGYSTAGFYFYTDDTETSVEGPFETFEEAEVLRIDFNMKHVVDTNGPET